MKLSSAIFLFLLTFSGLYSQSTFIVVDSIHVEGNKGTKAYIILNELDIAVGDTIYFNDLAIKFKDNRNRVLDTGLFVDANFNIKALNSRTGNCYLDILVKESLFIYPRLIFNLADRNFNEWYYEHEADLSRINYGLELEHKNITGNKDALQLKWQRGITHKYELQYTRPYFHKNNKLGLTFNILYKYSKEIAYNTLNNKLVFYRNKDKNLLKQFRISIGLTHRASIFDTHGFTIGYYDNGIDREVLDYNKDFFLNRISQKYFLLSFSIKRDKRKYKMYPKGGFLIGGQIIKSGLWIYKDLNQLDISMNIEKYLYINKNYISAFIFKGKVRAFGDDLPYHNNKAIGYDQDLINGYDLYVEDGKHYLYLKTSQRLGLFSGILDMNKHVFIKQFKYIPYEIYLSINFDMAYVNNNVNFVNNSFNNRMLNGHGVGLDMIIYNSLFQINYSINHLGEDGFFFYYRSTF